LGGDKVLDLDNHDKMAAVVIPPRRSRFCNNFLGMVGPCFCWGFWKKRVVGRGVLVVNLWWIAGESWEVDGQFPGSKNMPLFPDLFLSDFHFGNLVQLHPLRLEDGYGKRADVDQFRLRSRVGNGVINMKTIPKICKIPASTRRRDQRDYRHQPLRQDQPHRHQIHPRRRP
jgi:hypothetical protein